MLFSAATTAAPGTQFMSFISILNAVEMNVFLSLSVSVRRRQIQSSRSECNSVVVVVKLRRVDFIARMGQCISALADYTRLPSDCRMAKA